MNTSRVLAVIAHHGTKNRGHLDRMLQSFRDMSHEVDVVVLSEAPKDLPDDVEVLVGLPSVDPWSLPFGHREVFAERRDHYDLFLYSEDDTLVEQRHLDRFLSLARRLPEDLVTGFQRFEEFPDGRRSYCSVHSHYHWDPQSVRRIGDVTVARFTNDHGAAYVLTREQLDRAIRSGGFLVPPHAGRYDMLVSAATDIYTQCGFEKVFCLEAADDQVVHHLPNVYLGQLGICSEDYQVQLDALAAIAAGEETRERLFDPVVRLPTDAWDRHAFPDPKVELTDLLEPGTRRVLSFGMASGAVEESLLHHGIKVVGIPVDAILGAVARRRGIETLQPWIPTDPLEPFDVVLCLDVLGYLARPAAVLRQLGRLLRPGGSILATVPDQGRYALRNRLRRPGNRLPLPRSWARHGLARTDARWVRAVFRDAGLGPIELRHRRGSRQDPVGLGGAIARLVGNTLLARARIADRRTDGAPRRQAAAR